LRCLYECDLEGAGGIIPLVGAALAEELVVQKLAPWVYGEIAGLGWEKFLPPPSLEFLRNAYVSALLQGAKEEEEVIQVLQALAEAGVEAVVLKGADLRLRLYGDWALRPMLDVDLLVAPEIFYHTQEVLFRLGYRDKHCRPRRDFFEKFEHEKMLAPPPGKRLGVDLHREIRAAAGFYRLPSAFWQGETVVLDYKGVAVRVLKPELMVVHLCLHAFDDRYVYRLPDYEARQLLDLALISRRFPLDWTEIWRQAARGAGLLPLSLVLQKINSCFPGCIPANVLEQAAASRPGALEKIVLGRALGYVTNYLPMFLHHSPRQWLFFLTAKLWPDPEYISKETPGSSRASYLGQFLRKLID
jgi:hypothetical protein